MARTIGKTAAKAAVRAAKAVSKAAIVTAATKAATRAAGKVATTVSRPRRTSKLKKAGKLAAVAAVVVGSAYAGRKLMKKRGK